MIFYGSGVDFPRQNRWKIGSKRHLIKRTKNGVKKVMPPCARLRGLARKREGWGPLNQITRTTPKGTSTYDQSMAFDHPPLRVSNNDILLAIVCVSPSAVINGTCIRELSSPSSLHLLRPPVSPPPTSRVGSQCVCSCRSWKPCNLVVTL